MTLPHNLRIVRFILAFSATVLLFLFSHSSASAQTDTDPPAGFTYQGYLEVDGAAASGTFDLEFRLYDAEAGGSQIGPTVTADDISVQGGVFTTVLDFGDVFTDGNLRYLGVAIRDGASTSSYTTLEPRDALRPTPSAFVAHRALSLRNVTVDDAGNVGIGTDAPTSTLTVDGTIETLSGGITFPDGTTQTTAGVGSSDGWNLTGNAGTNAGDNFLGTTDDQPLEIRVANSRVLRLDYGIDETRSYTNVLAGHESNTIPPEVVGATISGGGSQEFDEPDGDEYGNSVMENFGTIGGGSKNTILALSGTIGGGRDNVAGSAEPPTPEGSVVGGGLRNDASGTVATIGGGISNTASARGATVAGGRFNVSSGNDSVVGGGAQNQAVEFETTVSGGAGNVAEGALATIGGGIGHVASGSAATISGGDENTASASRSSVGGGDKNVASGTYARVGGGIKNTADASSSVVAGGRENASSGAASTVGGGESNSASGTHAVISGGWENIASGEESYVGGGWSNRSLGAHSVVSGGQANYSTGRFSAVGGGLSNAADGEYASVPGGRGNNASADLSFAAGHEAYIDVDHTGTFVWSDASRSTYPVGDGSEESFVSTGPNQYLIQAAGGVGIGTNTPVNQLTVVGNVTGSALASNHVALIENDATDGGDVLALKTSDDQPDAGENFITFKSINADVGAIEGDGAGGVVFTSGGADFAEMLPRLDSEEVIRPGDVVGVVGGHISLDTENAKRLMVVTDRALIVGNVPAEGKEQYERVAFIGQVPVRVAGPVSIGDLIVASGENDGVGRAVTAAEWIPGVHGPVVGQAWESRAGGTGRVNAAVGVDTTMPLFDRLERQQQRIDRLERSVERLDSLLDRFKDRIDLDPAGTAVENE